MIIKGTRQQPPCDEGFVSFYDSTPASVFLRCCRRASAMRRSPTGAAEDPDAQLRAGPRRARRASEGGRRARESRSRGRDGGRRRPHARREDGEAARGAARPPLALLQRRAGLCVGGTRRHMRGGSTARRATSQASVRRGCRSACASSSGVPSASPRSCSRWCRTSCSQPPAKTLVIIHRAAGGSSASGALKKLGAARVRGYPPGNIDERREAERKLAGLKPMSRRASRRASGRAATRSAVILGVRHDPRAAPGKCKRRLCLVQQGGSSPRTARPS